MAYQWDTCSTEIKDFVTHLLEKINDILGGNLTGVYLHGSLAMGGFNPNKSDIDILVVTKSPLAMKNKGFLAELLLKYSKNPFPLEAHFLHERQLEHWEYPTSFDFHYSEYWRQWYEDGHVDLEETTDVDLAAHITIINKLGISLAGKPIKNVFPIVPKSDYLSSILSDFNQCIENIKQDPVYCILNIIRVYWYLKEGVICSKQEAGEWGQRNLLKDFQPTIQKALEGYANQKVHFQESELFSFRDYIASTIEK
jgi:predicted nucleotidyltransferase